ncbi:MAG: HEPN domain-containing protein [Candidatus Latescibacterota bacterium]
MKIVELNRQAQSIKRLIKSTAESTNFNLELQGHWGKYLCVLASGFLENAISEIYIELASNSSSPQVTSFTRRMLDRIHNPMASKFIETACSFKREWGAELKEYFELNPKAKEAIDSIMRNRHLIAHGKTATVSVARLAEYLDGSIEALEFIENQCGIA